MKRRGILNGQFMQKIASSGLTDTFLIGDAGMPIPPGISINNLVLTLGIPALE
jgi:D-ribose pyranase